MNKKILISQIQNKQFNVVYKGYKVEEVNDFLDEIILCYIDQNEELIKLKSELEMANDKIERLIKEKREMQIELEENHKENWKLLKNSFSDADIMKRISRIENSLGKNEERMKKMDEILDLVNNKLKTN